MVVSEAAVDSRFHWFKPVDYYLLISSEVIVKRNWGLIAACSILVVSLAPAESKPALLDTGQQGRYQLQAVTVDEGPSSRAAHEVFLLDSESGKLWRFQPQTTVTIEGKNQYVPDTLVQVTTIH